MKCREVTLNYERSQFEELPLAKRLLMRLHLMYCEKCNRYIVDSKALDTVFKKNQRAVLSSEEKAIILSRIL